MLGMLENKNKCFNRCPCAIFQYSVYTSVHIIPFTDSIENSNRQIPVETSSFFSLSLVVHVHRELQQTQHRRIAALIVRKAQHDVPFIVHRLGRSLCLHR
jgi:hypothetical protein